MSSSWEFLRRIRSLDSTLGGEGRPPPDVARVQIVDNGHYRGSRERAPYARHWAQMAAPAAGEHAGFFVQGFDRAGPLGNCAVLIHQVSVGGGPTRFALLDPASLTYSVAPAERTPIIGDNDDEVRCRIFDFNIATAQMPATTVAGVAGSAASTFPANGLAAPTSLPMAMHWLDGAQRALMVIFASAATEWSYTVQWQAVRL